MKHFFWIFKSFCFFAAIVVMQSVSFGNIAKGWTQGSIKSDKRTSANKSVFDLNFKWKNEMGEAFDLTALKGQRVIISMAYLSCKMKCPMIMRRLKKVEEILDDKKSKTNLLFVTIDPRLDTPERILEFKKKWKAESSRWHFAIGSEADTKKLAEFLGFRFEELDGHIEHESKLMALDERGVFQVTIDNGDFSSSEVY